MARKKQNACPEKWQLGEDFVPKGRYIDPDFLQLEYDKLFSRVWQMVCREEEIPEIGSYLEYVIGNQSVIVVRTEADRISAFHNACIHRGTQLVRGTGRVEEFRCPFHGWRYDLSGQCTFMFCENEFLPRPAEFMRLPEVRCDRWGGWVFINFDDDAESLLDWLDPLPTALGPYRLQDMRYAWHKRTILPANWKTAIDAFIEGYHTPGTHPQYVHLNISGQATAQPCKPAEFAYTAYCPTFTFRNHSRFIFGVREGAEVSGTAATGAPEAIRSMVAYQLKELRALNNDYDLQAAEELCNTALPEGVPLYQRFGELRTHYAQQAGINSPQLTTEQIRAGQGDWHMYPTMINLVEPGNILGYRSLPNGNDPDSCIFDVWSLQYWPEGKAPRVKVEWVDDWESGDWGQVLKQDFRNMGWVQRGLHSKGFNGHWLNTKQEMSVHNAHRIANRFLFGIDD